MFIPTISCFTTPSFLWFMALHSRFLYNTVFCIIGFYFHHQKTNIQQKNGQEVWTNISPKKIFRSQISTWKNAHHLKVIMRCHYTLLFIFFFLRQIKPFVNRAQFWEVSSIERIRNKKNKTGNKTDQWCQVLMRRQRNQNSYILLVGMQICKVRLENSLAVSYKLRCTLTILAATSFRGIHLP